MLLISVPEGELFNNQTSTYIYTKKTDLKLEHSLISISEWEKKWKKPYLAPGSKTYMETVDYVRCMTINKGVDENVYFALTKKNIEDIQSYINDTMTATTVPKNNGPSSKEVLSSELIYYYMIQNQIPFDCEKWHLNRLLTLIEVCSFKNIPPDKRKMPTNEIYARNKAINEARKAKYKTRG